jgi:hypothetical protein
MKKLLKTVTPLLLAATIPVSLVTMFGGTVSGIWLAILGEWGVIGTGILALFVSSFLLGFALMPSLIFAIPAMALFERGNKVGGYILMFLNLIYTYAILIFWSLSVLIYYREQASNASLIPILFWSYGVATGPISFLASKDLQGGNEHAMFPTVLMQVAYLAAIFGIIFLEGMSFLNIICLFILTMSICLFVQLAETGLILEDNDIDSNFQ